MTESISSGKFITVEGIDGCGKTTQAESVSYTHLRAHET